VSLKSLGRNEEPFRGKTSRQNKVGKNEVTEAMIVLLASTEEHERSYLKPTFRVAANPWDTECLA